MKQLRILTIGAHPDDIEIGVGGTIRKFTKDSHTVKMLFIWMPTHQPGKEKQREEEGKEAAKILGAEAEFLNFNPERVVLLRDLVKIIEQKINKFKPDEIYTQWIYDSHQEHRLVSEAVISATRKNNCSVYMYEPTIPGGLVPQPFRAQMFIDISEEIDDKIKALEQYKSQLELYGDLLIKGVRGRALFRGFQIHKRAAECFEIIKEIKKIGSFPT